MSEATFMQTKRTAVGIIREKINWIENRLHNGHSREAIWEELRSKHGLTVTFSSFLKTVHRVRAERKNRRTVSKITESATEALSVASEQAPKEISLTGTHQSPAPFIELQKCFERLERQASENYTRLQRTLILIGSGIFLATLLSNLWPLFL